MSYAIGLILAFALIVLLFICMGNFRRRYIIQPLLKKIQKNLPVISQTEKEALEAGNTWWEKDLFSGSPDWKKLLNIPAPVLTNEEQNFLNNQVEQLCAMLNDWEIINVHRDLPQSVWEFLKKEKFFGMVIPQQYGGHGFSALAHSTVVVKIASRSISTAVNTMVPNSLGPGELLLHYGTEEQKNYYLPRLAAGLDIPCFALTSPDAGSDAGSMPDTGIVCQGEYEGKTIIGIRLNWNKRYITLAPVATVLGLAFYLYDPDHLLGQNLEIGITLCLIPTSHPGVEIGHRHYPLQLAFMNGPTYGKDVFIPTEWIIGGPTMMGQGWRMLMECLSIGRSISLPSLATACGKMAYRNTGAYAKIRRQFNTSIASFEGIEEALSRIAGLTYLLESTRVMTAGAVDLKIKPSVASAIAKYHMTEMSREVVAHAMDIHAGHMIQLGPRNFLAYAHFAIPISITVEGANILTRNLIIFGQGAIRCHPYLLKEVELLTNKSPNLVELDKTLLSHAGFFIGNLFRSFAYGLTGGRLIFTTLHKKIRRQEKQLTRMSTALATISDISLMLLGGSLKRKERISARMGDILSQLYMASAVIKYFYDHQCPDEDIDYVQWSIQYCLYKIQIAFNELFNNFPYKLLGKFLSFIIFPFGSAYSAPSDILSKKIVQKMLMPGKLRDQLTDHVYLSKESDNLSNRLEIALSLIHQIEPLWKKMQQSIKQGDIPPYYDFLSKIHYAKQTGILTQEESTLLTQFENLKNEIIKVNEFSFKLDRIIS
jgi:acyl-CoA dehydrogenase